MMKRSLDIAGSLCGLAFLAPFAPLIALAIILDDGLPVMVRLPRVSGGRTVHVWKFRSMVRGAPEKKAALLDWNERSDGPFFKIKNDPRLTRVGRVLRKFRLDEFPQFWNVLRGELSLVGPRPHEPEEVAAYPAKFRSIAEAKAGLTGLSQVSGASGLPFLTELELDRHYLERQSLTFDLVIIARTVWIFFSDPTGV